MNDQELMSFAIARSNDPIIKNPVLRDAMNKDLGPRIKAADGGLIDEALDAYKYYLKTRKSRPSKKRYKEIPFTKFFEIYGRENFDKGGMAKLVSHVEGLPKGTTVTLQMVQDYVKKNKLEVNIPNFFGRKAQNIKGKKFISDTRVKDLKLTSEEKANIEKYGKAKYDKLTNIQDKSKVRKGVDVGSLAPEKTQKVKFKKEYDKAIKYYEKKGVEPNMDSLRRNIARNNGKFNPTGIKLRDEPGLTGLFKNYEKTDLIADLKKNKNLAEISIEYFAKNEKDILKMLEGKRDYTKPLGRLSTDLSNVIRTDKEATKLYNKVKKKNSFKKGRTNKKYVQDLETLLPFAQEQGLVPKVNAKGVKIDTASKYFQHAYKVKRDPIAKLFGFYEKVGIEHPGGVARALIFDDPATLNEIVATMPDTNTIAGNTYDTYATGQARFFEKTKDPKYINTINRLILNKQKEFGKPRTVLDVDGDNVTRRKTPFSLMNPNLETDAKSFITEYISQGGSKRKTFKKLNPNLQKAIRLFETNDSTNANRFLKLAMTDVVGKKDKIPVKEISAVQRKGIVDKLIKAGFRCAKAEGEFCDDPAAYKKSVKEQMAKAADGDTKAISKIRTMGKLMNGFKGAAKFTGWGVLGEIGFAAPFAALDYAKGANNQEIISNATMGLFGKSQDEQLREKYSDFGQAQDLLNTYNKSISQGEALDDQTGYGPIVNPQDLKNTENKLEKQSRDFEEFLPPSMGFRGDFDLDLFYRRKAIDDQRIAEQAEEKKQRELDRNILTRSTGLEAVGLAQGGIMNIRKK